MLESACRERLSQALANIYKHDLAYKMMTEQRQKALTQKGSR